MVEEQSQVVEAIAHQVDNIGSDLRMDLLMREEWA